MGCDIHLKTFIFSKVENRMVPVSDVGSDLTTFTTIVGDRNYDLFGLFGNNVRSWYPELECLKYGYPDCISKTMLAWMNSSDYHTRRYCMAEDLITSLNNYKERLLDPKKFMEYYDVTDDFIVDVVEGKIPLENYKTYHKNIIESIDAVLTKIKRLKDDFWGMEDIVDTSKIMFVTWMDN